MPSQVATTATTRGLRVTSNGDGFDGMKKLRGCLAWVLAFVLFVGLTSGMHALAERIDIWRFPWGHVESGRPTLTGTWVGPVTTGSGQRLGFLVSMRMAPIDSGRKWPGGIIRTRRNHWLVGRVVLCPRDGPVKHFTAWGAPDDARTASRFHLALYPADSVPPDGLAPSHIQGRWSGGDTLSLAISLYLRRGKSAISDSADPDTKGDTPATLARGTEPQFNSLCSR
jgi:hypothetical protein